ncbi:MAG TPA: rhodanese-like domain-containing protein, partial [Limnochordia bacterium]
MERGGYAVAEYANQDAIVSTEWVAQHLDDPKVKLVEVDVQTDAYDEGHIRGAVGWNWTSQLQDRVRRDILSQEGIEALLSQSGISPSDTIVLYGDNNNWFAAYAYWLLKLYGHEDVKLMNGGRKKWLAEGRPVTKDVPRPQPTQYKAKPLNAVLRAKRDQVLAALGQAQSALVDVRSPQEFTGEILAPPGLPETAQRGGH